MPEAGQAHTHVKWGSATDHRVYYLIELPFTSTRCRGKPCCRVWDELARISSEGCWRPADQRHAQKVFVLAFLGHSVRIFGLIDGDDAVASPNLACSPLALSVPCIRGPSTPDVIHKKPFLVSLAYDFEAKGHVVCPPQGERESGRLSKASGR